jgi:hypothetical protein
MVIGAYVAVEEPEFAILDQAIGVFKIRLTGSDGFDLGAS